MTDYEKLKYTDKNSIVYVIQDVPGSKIGAPKINIIGEDIDNVDWGFQRGNTFASQGQKMIYWGPLKPLEKALLRSPITPLAYVASNLYHNEYWLRFIGKQRINKAMQTRWGNLFRKY